MKKILIFMLICVLSIGSCFSTCAAKTNAEDEGESLPSASPQGSAEGESQTNATGNGTGMTTGNGTGMTTGNGTGMTTGNGTGELESSGDTVFDLDNENLYAGMDVTYRDGYTPVVANGYAHVVLPLVTDTQIKDNRINVAVNLGETANSPFVYKNYQKKVYLTNNVINGNGARPSYLIDTNIQLSNTRINGTYPVNYQITAKDSKGNNITQSYTIYVTITDGKIPDGTTPTPTETTTPTNAKPFVIDTRNVYSGMKKSYSRGYSPVVSGGYVNIVLPLTSSIELKDNVLQASAECGEGSSQMDTSSAPSSQAGADSSTNVFVMQNNKKKVRLKLNRTKNGSKKKSVYLVKFRLPLNKKRYNGTYSVNIVINAMDKNGNGIEQSFPIYFNVTDGKNPPVATTPTPEVTEKPTSEPKIIVDKYKFNTNKIVAGKEFSVDIWLKNTSKIKDVSNMTVSVACDSTGFILKNDSNVFYIDSLKKQGTTKITLKYQTDCNITTGQYKLNLNMSYDNPQATKLDSSGSVFVSIEQPLKIKIEANDFPSNAEAGDSLPFSVKVMNMSRTKIYNARCTIKGKGMESMGTGFIGDVEASMDAQCSMEVMAMPLDTSEDSTKDSRYGYTSGEITLTYEDAAGKSYKAKANVDLVINAPSAINGKDKDNSKKQRQWWITMGIGAVVIIGLIAGGYFFMRRRRMENEK